MKNKKEGPQPTETLSKCCNAPTKVDTSEDLGGEGTSCFVCSKCGKFCDISHNNLELRVDILYQFFDEDMKCKDFDALVDFIRKFNKGG
jgi:transcription elongation factor Elf1